MLKLLVLLIMFVSLYGIQIEIFPEHNITLNKKDIEAFKFYVKEKLHFIMNEKGAEKVVKENKILANEYLKQGMLTPFEKRVLKVELEKRLADSFVKNMQKKVKIPKDVLKSYYEDHIDEFKKSDEIHIIRYRFNVYDNAFAFYKGERKISGKAKKDLGFKTIDSLKEKFKSFIEKNRSNYCLPPIVLKKNVYDVICIVEYRDNSGNYLPFEKVSKKIETLLYNKTFTRERAKVLGRYK